MNCLGTVPPSWYEAANLPLRRTNGRVVDEDRRWLWTEAATVVVHAPFNDTSGVFRLDVLHVPQQPAVHIVSLPNLYASSGVSSALVKSFNVEPLANGHVDRFGA